MAYLMIKKSIYLFFDQPTAVGTLILAFLLTLSPVIIYYEQKKRGLRRNRTAITTTPLPEASGAWPVIGHLLLFMNENDLNHVTLGHMADKYGPIFSLRFGRHRTLVVSSWEMVKECFTGTNDKLFSNRPSSLAVKLMFYDTESYGFAPYGKYWRELRKISTHKLLSNQQLEKFKHLRISEVDNSFKKLHELCSNNKQGGDTTYVASLVRMDDWFAYLTFNVIGRIVSGFQSNAVAGATNSQEKYKLAIDEVSNLMATFAVSDVVPRLGWIDRLTGLTGKMKNCGKKLDAVVGDAVEDHRQKKLKISRNNTGALTEHEEEDFIDVCLSIMEQSQIPGNHPEISVKSIALDMLSGGSDTTKLIMTWTLSLLLNHPDILDKAKEEVDTYFGKKKISDNTPVVDAADVPNLVYIQAIIKESMRLYPASTLMERMTSDDCDVGGFHVPAGTRLWVNVWKMQRDPRVWKDPLVFLPERFLSNDKGMVDVKGQNYELIPFGTGRRICPGASFALEVLHLVLTRLILEFEMKAPEGKIDMRARPGFFHNKVVPLDVQLTPRTLD
ncbi:hypothetical protein C5167_047515 [Papaver somniferum]|uniref:(S)-N-methylcanadine 1-hydroxylase CYP82Y1 n=2 Tax=Papaver somniferum TaxID=3469 RepID=C82Y1_PAPSO|nr:bifunctional protein STORR-like [Papaver somniferum]I3PLR1.1 RecName: Full=(S)-N-methylcanadine 1-hydroxylase CYP82Y1; AltName: Full=Cytochrome P450 82Y1 [Papaver somniferum]AFB74617.1 cytochrome P450 [Papaver somniferum]RZC84733.1 hypothetical protein C5167_047515 [Papaver somniferum]